MAKTKPYILTKAVGALKKYKKLSAQEAFKQATTVLQGVGLIRPGSHTLTRWGKILEKRLKISKSKRGK